MGVRVDPSVVHVVAERAAHYAKDLDAAIAALAGRSYYSRYPESPSPRVYGESAASSGLQAYQAHLDGRFEALADQPTDGLWVGSEVSPYGVTLGATYPHLHVDAAVEAAHEAMGAWLSLTARQRAAVCLSIVDAINERSFEIANAVMHTSGQPFVMAFQAGGPHAQDRAVEAIVAGLVEQERVPSSVVWEKPARDTPVRMRKDYRIVPRGLSLVVCCATFPTWNTYPGLFASLVTGNPVIVKPHPGAVLPVAITVSIARQTLRAHGLDPALVQLAPEAPGEGLARELARRPEVAIVDYTGGREFGEWLERNGADRAQLVFAEKSGVNSVVIDSTDDVRAMLANLAFSLTLYSGQMCTTPQNLYLPASGIDTDDGHLSVAEVSDRLARAIDRLTSDDARAVELLGATVNDSVRLRAATVADLAAYADGRVVLDSRAVSHPTYPGAVVRTPALVAVRAEREDAYTEELFGPVALLIETASTAQSLAQFRDTVREHGAMTAAVYSTDADVLDAAREAAADAGVALSENLTGSIYVNQTAAFSDYHGTGANPAANAAYVDAAFVAGRFRVVTSRRHIA